MSSRYLTVYVLKIVVLIFQTALNLNDLWRFGRGEVCVCVCICVLKSLRVPLKSQYAATRLNWRVFFLNYLNDLIEYCSYLRLRFLTRIEAFIHEYEGFIDSNYWIPDVKRRQKPVVIFFIANSEFSKNSCHSYKLSTIVHDLIEESQINI